MIKEDVLQVLIESFEAQGKLFNLVPKYIPHMKDYNERDDIDARLYKGVFSSWHCINERIHLEIYK